MFLTGGRVDGEWLRGLGVREIEVALYVMATVHTSAILYWNLSPAKEGGKILHNKITLFFIHFFFSFFNRGHEV